MRKDEEKPDETSVDMAAEAEKPASDDPVRPEGQAAEAEKDAEAVEWETPPPSAGSDAAARLDAAEKKAAEAEKQRLLALAEMDNQRKRFAKEMDNLRRRVVQDTLTPFLQVLDHFNMAVKAAETPGAGTESILKGLSMIATEFDRAFTELGVEKIDAAGKPFDPNFHEAVAEEPSDTVPAGVVIRQWSMGCRMGDHLLKPALVVVSSGPPADGKKEPDGKS